MEEKLINKEHAKTFELIGAGMEITDPTLDIEKRDEEELVVAMKELKHFLHLDEILLGHYIGCGVPEERIPEGLQQIYR
jgi:hypothetical protein